MSVLSVSRGLPDIRNEPSHTRSDIRKEIKRKSSHTDPASKFIINWEPNYWMYKQSFHPRDYGKATRKSCQTHDMSKRLFVPPECLFVLSPRKVFRKIQNRLRKSSNGNGNHSVNVLSWNAGPKHWHRQVDKISA